jgi:phosphate transport system ATP-binding protein
VTPSSGSLEKLDIRVADPDRKVGRNRVKIRVRDFSFYYGQVKALHNINMDIRERTVVGIIGPSGCGKSTYLRCFNRMNDVIWGVRHEGDIVLEDESIFDRNLDVVDLRRRVGMVFQKSNPFPKSVFENVAYGLKINGVTDRNFIARRVEESLKASAIWDEVKDRLHKSAYALSGGQQQRLCIARALAVRPRILLLDEPASALDPIATAKIEALIHELKKDYTIIIVTHNMQQAARVSDFTAFFMLGELVEFDFTNRIFTNPSQKVTEDYVTGRFG